MILTTFLLLHELERSFICVYSRYELLLYLMHLGIFPDSYELLLHLMHLEIFPDKLRLLFCIIVVFYYICRSS